MGKMERTNGRLILTGLVITLGVLFASGPAFAIGTVGGYQITNQATASCENAAAQVLNFTSNQTIVTVNTVYAVEIDGGNNYNPTQGTTNYALFTVFNAGNAAEPIDYNVVGFRAGGDPDITLSGNVYHDTGCDGYDAGDVLLAGVTEVNVSPTDAGYATNGYCLLVEYAVAPGAIDGDAASLDVSVASSNDGAQTDTTELAGDDEPDLITVGGPNLGVVKSYTNVTNPGMSGDNQTTGAADPGDVIEYTIVVTNNGSADALNTSLADTIDGECNYVVASLTIAADCAGCSSVFDDSADPLMSAYLGVGAGAGVGGTLAPAAVVTITFQCQVDNS